MIKHHPTTELLQAFVGGELPASMCAAVAMHNEMCPLCQTKVATMTELQAEDSFELPAVDNSRNEDDVLAGFDMEAMIGDITASDETASETEEVPVSITVKGKTYQLPRAMQHMPLGRWSNIGKLTRSRMELGEGELHSSLLQIDAGGSVPEHTHKGYEVTLLLDGSFKDEMGEYVKGDFILLDASHKHQPVTEDGCLCFTVANDALHFTQGINKLLNPFANLIY
ncbi:ChrR family anti-sigma-E factor [Thalassotalea sp. Y01]|uniref:ChrR family anti-sigma-E factor n=1 Tax=Thalassotalea sp. Y01 TaxID=2729613 RepID=UPI00145E69F5|nr:ChrR family anti-sigma-E factor [Thalassotalea sp. Y01]NMP15089.1 transcriptional regulator [Thalassotalea sp. Y01]